MIVLSSLPNWWCLLAKKYWSTCTKRKIDWQFGFSALCHVLPESCIQQTVYQAKSSVSYISSCQIPLLLVILPGEAMDERKNKSTWLGLAITDTQMQPKYTDLGNAPDELLSQIHCKCKTKQDIILHMQKARTYLYPCMWSMSWYPVKTQGIQTLLNWPLWQHAHLTLFRLGYFGKI